MFEDKRTCAWCGRLTEWSEPTLHCSDQKIICFNCLRLAYLPEPSIREAGKIHPWPSSMILNRIQQHMDYDAFREKKGTEVLLNGQLLINEMDRTFAIGCNDYDTQMLGFQSGNYETIDSISINDGVQTKSVKISDGDSGAAGALFGGLVFGPLGAVVGGLGTRESEKYGEIKQTDNVGFTITHTNTSHDNYNVLNLCLNYEFVNYETQRDVYEAAKNLTIKICEELLRRVDKIRPKADTQKVQQQPQTVPASGSININPDNVEPTITRIELFLEDNEWDSVRAYSNAALDYFPTDYRLYMFLLFADLKVSSLDDLEKCSISFANNGNYKKAIRFADEDTAEKLKNRAAIAEGMQKNESTSGNDTEKINIDNYATESEETQNRVLKSNYDIINDEDPNYQFIEYGDYG